MYFRRRSLGNRSCHALEPERIERNGLWYGGYLRLRFDETERSREKKNIKLHTATGVGAKRYTGFVNTTPSFSSCASIAPGGIPLVVAPVSTLANVRRGPRGLFFSTFKPSFMNDSTRSSSVLFLLGIIIRYTVIFVFMVEASPMCWKKKNEELSARGVAGEPT